MLKEARLIIPTKDKQGVDASQRIAREVKFLCRVFGGATESEGVGSWLDGQGVLIREPVRIIDVACDEASDWEVRDAVCRLGAALDQDAVYFRGTSGRAEIIDRKYFDVVNSKAYAEATS